MTKDFMAVARLLYGNTIDADQLRQVQDYLDSDQFDADLAAMADQDDATAAADHETRRYGLHQVTISQEEVRDGAATWSAFHNILNLTGLGATKEQALADLCTQETCYRAYLATLPASAFVGTTLRHARFLKAAGELRKQLRPSKMAAIQQRGQQWLQAVAETIGERIETLADVCDFRMGEGAFSPAFAVGMSRTTPATAQEIIIASGTVDAISWKMKKLKTGFGMTLASEDPDDRGKQFWVVLGNLRPLVKEGLFSAKSGKASILLGVSLPDEIARPGTRAGAALPITIIVKP